MSNKYNDQIFINCPFDNEYQELFYAIVFTILDCGFIPRCTKEINDSSKLRLVSIVKIIRECKYGIHDLSRIELDTKHKLPRFNMPFELGIFYGAKMFGLDAQKKKNFIILEKEDYRYQKYISDLSGADIKNHNNKIEECIVLIRDWLKTSSRRETIPDGNRVISRYNIFLERFKNVCSKRGIDYKYVPFIDLTFNMSNWLQMNQEITKPLFD